MKHLQEELPRFWRLTEEVDMSQLKNDQQLLVDTDRYLSELKEAGVIDVNEMARHLKSVFFTEEWETFLILENWVYNTRLRESKHDRCGS